MEKGLSIQEKEKMSFDTAEIELKIRNILVEMDSIILRKKGITLQGGSLPIVFNYRKQHLAAYGVRQKRQTGEITGETFYFSLRYFSKAGDYKLDDLLFRYVVMHEYGHFMVQHLYSINEEPHGPVWKKCCREIGIIPRAIFQDSQRGMSYSQLFLPHGYYEQTPVVKALYQIGDIIEHPAYGKGEITALERTQLGVSLTVRFALIEKRLDQKWVMAHCL